MNVLKPLRFFTSFPCGVRPRCGIWGRFSPRSWAKKICRWREAYLTESVYVCTPYQRLSHLKQPSTQPTRHSNYIVPLRFSTWSSTTQILKYSVCYCGRPVKYVAQMSDGCEHASECGAEPVRSDWIEGQQKKTRWERVIVILVVAWMDE